MTAIFEARLFRHDTMVLGALLKCQYVLAYISIFPYFDVILNVSVFDNVI